MEEIEKRGRAEDKNKEWKKKTKEEEKMVMRYSGKGANKAWRNVEKSRMIREKKEERERKENQTREDKIQKQTKRKYNTSSYKIPSPT